MSEGLLKALCGYRSTLSPSLPASRFVLLYTVRLRSGLDYMSSISIHVLVNKRIAGLHAKLVQRLVNYIAHINLPIPKPNRWKSVFLLIRKRVGMNGV